MSGTETIADRPSSSFETPRSSWFRRERLLFSEWVKLLIRDPKKYGPLTVALYFADVTGKTRGIRPAYFVCRAMDDIADGDRELPAGVHDYPSLVTDMLRHLDGGVPSPTVCGDLLRETLHIPRRNGDRDEIILNLRRSFQSMLVDYERRKEQQSFTALKLSRHYENSFAPVHNIALIAMGSRSHAADLGLLPLVQGKIYALQDLAHELPRGEINIPTEVILETRLTIPELMSHPDPTSIPAIRTWMESDRRFALDAIEELDRSPPQDKKAQLLLNVLLPEIRKFLRSSSWA